MLTQHCRREALRALAGLLVIGALPIAEAHAQRVIPGFGRVDQSDVTGPSVTSGDLSATAFGEPGTIQNIQCPVAWGIRDATWRATQRLASADGAEVEFPSIPASARGKLRSLLLGDGDADAAAASITAALVKENAGARGEARRLVGELRGLFTVLGAVDPLNPDVRAATGVALAVGRYNRFVEASSAGFLASPPPEFEGIRVVLSELATAALENEARPTDPAIVDARGVACAPMVATAAVSAPPERLIEICVLTQTGEFRYITARFLPESGDTIVMLAGERRAFSEVYDRRGRQVTGTEWGIAQEEIEFRGTRYLPYGMVRTVERGDVRKLGEYRGVSLFALTSDGDRPEYVYFPASDGCEVQPYRRVEEVRRVRG